MSRRSAIWIAALAVAWGTFVLFVVPWVIRSAWAGESLAFLNAAIQGRDVHPASHYVSLWHRAALGLTGGLAAAAVVSAVAWRWRGAWVPRLRSVIRGQPSVGWTRLLSLGVVAGGLAGLAEAVPLVARATLLGDPREAPAPELLWMAPLAAAVAGFIVAALIGLVLRARRGIGLRPLAVLFGAAVFFTLLGALRLGLHRHAVTVLALGLGSLVAPAIARRPRSHLLGPVAAGFVLALPVIAGVASVALPANRSQRAESGARSPSGSPNVLFLILDTVRSRSLSLYGYERETTPQLTRWLSDGVIFEHAIAPTPWTLPSHASMFTGLEPHALSTDFDRALDDAYPTLAETLRDRGYSTGAFVANLIYTTRLSGLDRGFTTYSDHPVSFRALLASSRWTRLPTERIRAFAGMHGMLVRKTAEDVNDEFLDWLRRLDDRPFFAFLNYFDAHSPYETHSPFDTKFTATPPRYWLMRGWQRSYTEEQRQEFVDAYESAIAYLDHHIGELLAELERRGILENTLLVIVSDHGESLGENDILVHANSLYMPQLRVPLAIRMPRRVPGGLRIDSPVSLRDLPATVLDLAAVNARMPGRSLRSLWQPGPANVANTGRSPGVFSELTYNRFAHPDDPIQLGLMRSIVDGRWHYIRNGDGSEELYDFRSDSDETIDLAASESGRAALVGLRQALRAHLDGGSTDVVAGGSSPRSAGPPAQRTAEINH